MVPMVLLAFRRDPRRGSRCSDPLLGRARCLHRQRPSSTPGRGKAGLPAGCNARREIRCDARSVRCVIVDDNEAFLEDARDLLVREGIDVVGVATTIAGALETI